MRSILSVAIAFILFTFVGCGGSGGSGGAGGTTVTPPPNPNNGVATYANGVQFDTNVNPASPTSLALCQATNQGSWQFCTSDYLLTGFGARSGSSISFIFNLAPSGNVWVGGVPVSKMRMDFGGGTVETRYLALGMDGALYVMGVSGTVSDDFTVVAYTGSPKALLGPSLSVGASWTGGFSGHDAMSVIATNVTAPSGETGCIEIQQVDGGVTTDWWFIKTVGFVCTQRVSDGYSRAVSPTWSGFSRIPYSNG